jgi:hypothetical protein
MEEMKGAVMENINSGAYLPLANKEQLDRSLSCGLELISSVQELVLRASWISRWWVTRNRVGVLDGGQWGIGVVGQRTLTGHRPSDTTPEGMVAGLLDYGSFKL